MIPCGQYGKGGGQDQCKLSARAPACHDLVNPGGRKQNWGLSLREDREAGNAVLDSSMGGGSGHPTRYAPNLRETI